MKYKLTIYPAIEAGDIWMRFLFETKKELETAKNSCADLLLFMQDSVKIMDDFSNCFICEENINGEWVNIDE